MFWSANHSRPPIGIDIGSRRFKAAQLDCAGRQIAAAAMPPRAQVGPVPTPEEVRRLAGVLERSGFKGRRIVLPAPPEKLLSDVLELPRSAGVSLEQLARMELARTHRCAPDSLEMGCWELPAAARAGKSAQVMAVACKHEDATPLLDVFESQGLDVVALDVRSCALARAASLAMAAHPVAENTVTAVLDFGWNAATLVLLYQGTIVYERKVAEGGLQELHAELCKRLNVDSEVADYLLMEVGLGEANADTMPEQGKSLLGTHLESLANDLTASFTYAGHQYHDAPLATLLLAGGGAVLPGVDKQLAKQLSIPIRRIAPADLLLGPAGQNEATASPALVAAIGLAMFPAKSQAAPATGACAA